MAGNSRSGRRPKPAEKRAREGGTDRRGAVSHRPKTELVVVAGRNVPIAPPDDLPVEAQELWTEIVRVLAEAGIVDTIDLPMLRQLTLQYARATQAAKVLDEPIDEEELADLNEEIQRAEHLARALQLNIGTQLQAGLSPAPAQVNALSNYEQTIMNKRAYRDSLQRVGRVVALGSTGQLVEHPMVATERAAASLLLRFASEYAMTPVARARLGIAVLEGRSIQRDLEDDIGSRRRVDATAKQPGSGRRPRKKTADVEIEDE